MKGERGFSFIEVIVALAVLGIIAVAFLGGLAGASQGLSITDERETAKNLAEAQMEYVKNLPYSASYLKSSAILNEYPNYDVTITTTFLEDSNIQKITVAVSHQDKAGVIILENYKVNR